jgi:hypothetical protein
VDDIGASQTYYVDTESRQLGGKLLVDRASRSAENFDGAGVGVAAGVAARGDERLCGIADFFGQSVGRVTRAMYQNPLLTRLDAGGEIFEHSGVVNSCSTAKFQDVYHV